MQEDYGSVMKIFYETSSVKKFVSEDARRNFEFKYLGWYLAQQSRFAFVACEGNEILGYILGCADTQGSNDLLSLNPMLINFSDLYSQYPAHLHINLTERSRGLGIGSKLLETLESNLITAQVRGVHLITSPDASNRFFYQKNGYRFEQIRTFNGCDLLFMGKTLPSSRI